MSEFQLSLLIIGVVVVAGVYFYGLWQQWRYRRSVGDAFRPEQASVPGTTAAVASAPSSAIPELEPASPSIAEPPVEHDVDGSTANEVCGLLNEATDYVATFLLRAPLTSEVLAPLWERRFDFGKNIHACGLNNASGLWERLIPESGQSYRAFRLGLQLVDRSGAVSDLRLKSFRDLLAEIAADLQVEAKLPPLDDVLKGAQQLDRFCADVDQMIGINLLASGERKLFGTEVANAAERLGMRLQADGTFHLIDERGATLCSLSASDGLPFQHHTLNQVRVDSLTLLLDIPRVTEPARRFDEMVALARELEKMLRLTMTDDQRVALSDGAIAQIRAQVAATEQLMLAGHITPGSAQALRLFS